MLALLLATASTWIAPVPGPVLAPFDYSPARPFARGRRRGVRLGAARGAPVRAACAGRVTFAGAVPGRGQVVTVRCGAHLATHLGLARVAVGRGARVVAGRRLGVAAGAAVGLSARVAGRPFAYVDPLSLLGPDRAPAPPTAPMRRPRRVPPAASPPRVRPAAGPAGPAGSAPSLAWVGAALLAAGLPAGALTRRRRRGRASGAARRAAAHPR